MIGWSLFFTVVILAGIAHWRMRSFFLATLLSVAISTSILPIIDTLKKGYFDGWWIIAMITIGIQCLVVSIVVGIVMWLFRKYGKK